MAKCLRCGAGDEWLEGKIKAKSSDMINASMLIKKLNTLVRYSGSPSSNSEWYRMGISDEILNIITIIEQELTHNKINQTQSEE